MPHFRSACVRCISRLQRFVAHFCTNFNFGRGTLLSDACCERYWCCAYFHFIERRPRKRCCQPISSCSLNAATIVSNILSDLTHASVGVPPVRGVCWVQAGMIDKKMPSRVDIICNSPEHVCTLLWWIEFHSHFYVTLCTVSLFHPFFEVCHRGLWWEPHLIAELNPEVIVIRPLFCGFRKSTPFSHLKLCGLVSFCFHILSTFYVECTTMRRVFLDHMICRLPHLFVSNICE